MNQVAEKMMPLADPAELAKITDLDAYRKQCLRDALPLSGNPFTEDDVERTVAKWKREDAQEWEDIKKTPVLG